MPRNLPFVDMQALVAEVRLLRKALQATNGCALKAQFLLYRLQLQEGAVARVSQDPARSFGTPPHGLLVLLLPRTFTPPYLTPQGAHHHHPDHGNPELHAKPNGIQCVHSPPPLTTGCTPLRSRCPISRCTPQS